MTAPHIIRVFPRKTKATPDDALAYFGPPDQLAEGDEVHVFVTFTIQGMGRTSRREMEGPVS
jgi:hypothetical protein